MIPALERLVVGVPIHTIHNSLKLPSIDRFKDSAKSAIVKSHARPLCLDNQKAPVCIGPAGHALRHGELFPGQPCPQAGGGKHDAEFPICPNLSPRSSPRCPVENARAFCCCFSDRRSRSTPCSRSTRSSRRCGSRPTGAPRPEPAISLGSLILKYCLATRC